MDNYIPGLVSVIIPTYKRSNMLRKAIDTTLEQTYKNIELIIVNDNIPNDKYSIELYDLINSYSDERLCLVEQEKHINGAAARNAGIRKAHGEFIAFQDDDDYWEKTKIEEQVKILSCLDESWGAVSCLMRFYSDGKLVRSCLPYHDGDVAFDVMSLRIGLGTGAVLIRRTALDQSGYFDESLKRHQDLQLFACLCSKYKVKLVTKYLHNREIKDNTNRPNAEQLDEIKNNYFASISSILKLRSKREQEQIIIMHRFDTANSYKKSGNTKEFINRILCVFKYPKTIFMVIEKLAKRTIEKTFRYSLQKKYQ